MFCLFFLKCGMDTKNYFQIPNVMIGGKRKTLRKSPVRKKRNSPGAHNYRFFCRHPVLAWRRLLAAEMLYMNRVVFRANASSIYPCQVPDLNGSCSSNQHNFLSRSETGVASHCAASWTNSAWLRSCVIEPCLHRQ